MDDDGLGELQKYKDILAAVGERIANVKSPPCPDPETLKIEHPSVYKWVYFHEPPVESQLDEDLIQVICVGACCRKSKIPIGKIGVNQPRSSSNRMNQALQNLSLMEGIADEEHCVELPNFRLSPAALQHGTFLRKGSHQQLAPPPPPRQLSLANVPFYSRTEPLHEMPPLKHSRTEPLTHGSQDIQLANQLHRKNSLQHRRNHSMSLLSFQQPGPNLRLRRPRRRPRQ